MSDRERLHHTIDMLPEAEIGAALRFVEYLRDSTAADPLAARLLDAEQDAEPLTPHETAALDRASEEARAGELATWEEVRAQLARLADTPHEHRAEEPDTAGAAGPEQSAPRHRQSNDRRHKEAPGP